MGALRNCRNCGWADWSIQKPPCKACQEVGAFHKWKERKSFNTPDPSGHVDRRPDIEKYQTYFPFEDRGRSDTRQASEGY